MARFDTTALRTGAIHIAEKAAPPVIFGAEELRRYLEQMTGVRVRVVHDALPAGGDTLVLGTSAQGKTPTPADNGFAIVPEQQRIALSGKTPRALLSAVYALLEQLGCRWSLHGAPEEIVPRLARSRLDVAPLTGAPLFNVRGYCADIMTWHYTQPEYFTDRLADDRAFIDWMGKSGANTFFFIRHPFDTQLTIPELLPDFQQRGIDVEYGGHVIPLLLPRALYGAHPEYFPQAPDGARADHGNLCTSNATALDACSTNAVQVVRDHPEMRAIHIWGADLWHGGWCHCAECGALSVQDQSLRVCNAVARGLAEADVARPVCYLAYHDTIDPELTLRPEAHVVAEFAPRERCYGHALNDPQCTTNRRYAAALERHVELFDGRVRLFEYYGDAILFFGCTVPLTEVIAADMEYYRRLGIEDILMLQFGAFSLWAYPLNFLTFASCAMGDARAASAAGAYCARFGSHARAAAQLFGELETIMRRVVTYGDIRRAPRASAAAARVLPAVEAAFTQLADIAQRLAQLGDDALVAQAALVRYTQTVLAGVAEDLRQRLAGQPGAADARYAEALQLIEGVDRRFKGLWGTVDLAIVHSFFTAALESAMSDG